MTGVPGRQLPAPSQVSAPLQALPSPHEVPMATGVCVQAPLASQASAVHGLPSSQDEVAQVGGAPAGNPSWKVTWEPEPPTSTSRAKKAPVASLSSPSSSVPFGTSTSALTRAPRPNAAAFGLASKLPSSPFRPETSRRTPRAVSPAPAPPPMNTPFLAARRFAT